MWRTIASGAGIGAGIVMALTSHRNAYVLTMKIGRNDPCPCGSGKKYKHCCLGKPLPREEGSRGAAAAFQNAPALAQAPGTAADHYILGIAYSNQGRMDLAFNSHLRALRSGGDTPEMKSEFARCVRHIHFTQAPPDFRLLIGRAIAEGWARPGDLLSTGKSLVLLNEKIRDGLDRAVKAWPQRLSGQDLFGDSGFNAVANDPLFRLLLENVVMGGVDFERVLTMARAALLDSALETSAAGVSVGSATQDFCCALARQCFLNEYVYVHTQEEWARAGSLRELLASALATNSPVPALWVAAVAAYFPLNSVPGIDALSQQPALPEGIWALLKQQVHEPALERDCRARMQKLTAIDDATSRRVQEQYEEHPYPRWTKAAIAANVVSLDEFLSRRFPHSPFRPSGIPTNNRATSGRETSSRETSSRETSGRETSGGPHGVDILIAGCGTGQQSIETAQQCRSARVLAVDLSLTSLGFAKRKTDELGLKNIEYAQADLLKLGTLERTFDMIEALGVLHHLADPLVGWQTLLDKLRPGGVMHLGLYSELARANVVAGRDLIARRGFAANADDIRECRQVFMAPENAPRFGRLLSSPDFYAMSTCRDLLFHVQEHRYTLLQLKEMLTPMKLAFIGFDLEQPILQRYQERFPGDRAATNLDHWHEFEGEDPEIFAGMYQFWVQRPGKT